MRPTIGVTVSLDAAGRWRAGHRYHYLDAAYAAALEACDAQVRYLPPGPVADDALAGLDGLVIPGGDDFPAERSYPPEVRFELAPPEQIASDGAHLALARRARLPLLGICYGMQLLARSAGGRLHAHLPLDVRGAGGHDLPGPDARHGIEVAAGTRLASLLGAGECAVNSRHHQAVAEPGSDLVVGARAPDGVIEAIEARGERFELGVQWHPETMPEAHRRALLGGFVAACRSARR